MKLSLLSIILGVAYAIPQLFALLKPATFTAAAKKFPRHEGVGYVLMGLATAWFLYNLNAETISDFATYKTPMLIGFAALGVGTCIFVRDFLAMRGLAIFLLMLAWYTLNVARVVDSQWRLVIVTWAYLWVIAGMWLTTSPWRGRDWLNWLTAQPGRLKVLSGARLAFSILLIVLGIAVF